MERRNFLKNTGLAVAGVGLSGFTMPSVFAKGHQPSNKVVVAVAGVNSRGNGLARMLAQQPNCEVAYICDPDERAMARTVENVARIQTNNRPKAEKDFRKALEDKGVDALVIGMPDHWHAPASIIALSMGKHVFVEKPFSYDPNEGELLVEATKKYNLVVQMGSQRRSGTGLIQMVKDIREGIIGNVYMAKTWYANDRGPSFFKPAAIPSWLDYELWQGPAPRRPYLDGLVHYDWHWLWHWGTGEALNNGIHEVDVARWGLGVEFPIRVTSIGGRFHHKDDWETPDTQNISIEFPENKMITWEGRSCNKFRVEGADRGVIFYGDKGTIINKGGNSYTAFAANGRDVIKDSADATDSRDTTNPVSAGVNLDQMHIADFLECIRDGKHPNADADTGHRSTLLVQLGNIALRMQQTLNIDPTNGHILNPGAEKYWKREYERGWEPKV